jgi:hypothetical protein
MELTPQFFDSCKKLAKKLGCNVYDLLGVMYYESGCSAKAKNRHTGACGLIQFMPSTLRALGWNDGDYFQLLTAEEQMPYVEKYFSRYGKLPTLTHVYCAVFMPAELKNAHDPDTVLSDRSSKRSWAYAVNKSLDKNGDGTIRLGELAETVKAGCKGYRWSEIVKACGGKVPWALGEDQGYSISWVQTKLGVEVDGILGPKTATALKKFQKAKGLVADGKIGPATLKELENVQT